MFKIRYTQFEIRCIEFRTRYIDCEVGESICNPIYFVLEIILETASGTSLVSV